MRKIKNKKFFTFFLLLLLLTTGIFLLGPSAYADGEWAGRIIGGIIGILISALGLILILVIKGLILIAGYQHFIDSQAVILGWVIVRDVCNMFFVVILMIIAFGTILHLENYSYKKWLPKLILMAVLINFSKTICGLLIDVSQVIMLTFVNAFKDVGGANMIDILGISDIVTLAKSDKDTGFWTIIGAYILGLFYLIVAIIVIVTMLAMLTMRLVMIWIYVVLSPLAYLLATFPGGQSYASRWWSDFTKNLIVGPVLAFFIWLSFAALQTGNSIETTFETLGTASTQTGEEITSTLKMDTEKMGDELAQTKASTPGALIKFVVAIGMLIGGLKMAQEFGGEAGSIAGKGLAAISKGKGMALSQGKKMLTGENFLARKFAKVTGLDFRPVKLAESWKASMATSKRKDETAIREKAKGHYEAGGLRSVALGMGAGEDYFNKFTRGFLGLKGIKEAGQEIFTSPKKRREIGGKIDSIESVIKESEGDKSDLIEKKRPEIDKQVDIALATDKEYQKYKLNDVDVRRLTDLREKGSLTKAEKDEKKNLEENEEQAENRKATVKKEAEENFWKSDQEIVSIDAKIKADKSDLRKLKDEIMKVQKPVAFEARSLYRKDVEEAKSKYKSITNADELQKAYADAEKRGDKFDQIAILEKLSGDANLNEELKTKGYDSCGIGLHKYLNDEKNVHGENRGLKGKFSERERLQIENDLGESEERVGHWEMAKMAGMNSKGEMESLIKPKIDKKTGKVERDAKGNTVYDDMDHATHAYAEMIKMDPQKIVNSLNRLAIGGEDGFGEFQIANLGKMIYKYLASAGAFAKNPGRIVGNTAANLMSPKVVPILEKLMENDITKSNETIAILKERGITKDTGVKPSEMAAWLRKSGI